MDETTHFAESDVVDDVARAVDELVERMSATHALNAAPVPAAVRALVDAELSRSDDTAARMAQGSSSP